MKKVNTFRLLLAWAIVPLTFIGVLAQGVTTSSMQGKIVDANGEPLIGANILAVHQPSGTSYGDASDLQGNYRIPNMRVGGPYKISVSYTGYASTELDNVYLRLGEALKQSFTLQETAIELSSVVVSASSRVAGQAAGASTQITAAEIDVMPTLNRNINDYLRLTPQSGAYGDGSTFAGVNNRYNAIYIDGAVNNDVFGLSTSGTNGGQTGISPFSIDIIDQLQVVISPYDVTLGGFAGAGINAVTKSGTNKFAGTAYYFMQNENLAGKTNGVLADRLGIERTKLAEFNQRLYGLSIGGPIIKDKLFFFANAEIQDDETPVPFEIESYTGNSSPAGLDSLANYLINEYSYDPGGYRSTADELKGLKIFAKLDYNLSENNRLTLRHQYTKAEQFDRFAGSPNTINFSNNGIFFPSITNSTALELNSRFGAGASNNLILGYTRVKDDRDPLGGDFPYVFINDGTGTIRLGSEEFSTGNALDQDIFTLTDNFKLYKGNHTITIGTHNEFYSIYNLFIGQNYGTYRFSSLNSFLNNEPAIEYDRAYSLVDELTGDGSAAAAEFNAMQLGLYVQDEWTISKKFTVTGGLRVDLPIITSDPTEDTYLNDVALPKMQQFWEVANEVEAGKAPDGQIMISPRLGFNYDVAGNKKTVLRGGLGIFTSRIPFVWPGAMFNNNGLTLGRVDETNAGTPILFQSDITKQYTNPNFSVPSGQVDLFTKDFKYPQVFRANLALDQELPGGILATLEGLYTKTLNNVLYTNINDDPTLRFNWSGVDDRPTYNRRVVDATYSAVYVGSNTNEGYGYNITASLAKRFDFGLNAYVAYSYNDAEAVNEGTSSQNSSQWRGQVSTDGRNHPLLGRSDFALGHRILGSLSYKLNWNKGENAATTFSLFYNGQSGTAYSYVIGGSSANARNPNNESGSTSANRSLIYIPAQQSDIVLVDYTSSGVTVTAAEQWENLNAFIESDPYLSENRGQYAEKNASYAPFSSIFDFAIRQDVGLKVGGNTHKLQLSLDIFNIANLLNKEWGTIYIVPGSQFNNFELLQFESYGPDAQGANTVPRFSYRLGDNTEKDAYNIAGVASRWRMRFGVRYIFN